MSHFETLVKRTLEMQRASAHALPIIGPDKAISSMINKFNDIGIPDNLNTLALRMVRILRLVARLQVTISPPTLPAPLFPESAYQEVEFEGAYPRIEEPRDFVVTSRVDPLTSIIRRMVRSFLRRSGREKPEEEPPEPPFVKRERAYSIPDYIQRIAAAIPMLAYLSPERANLIPTISPFHPLHEYIAMASRIAGVTRPGVPAAPVGEYKEMTPTLIDNLQEYISATSRIAGVSKLEVPEISMDGVEEVIKTPWHSIQTYLDLASSLGDFMSLRAAAIYGMTPAQIPELEYLGGELDVSKTFDYINILREMVYSKVEVEKALTASLSGVFPSLPEIPIGKLAPEGVALQLPVSVPSPRLLDIVPLLSRVEAIPRAQRSTAVRRERVVERRRPIDIKVEPKISDIDLKELERKVARILREEARRYGVY